MSWAKFLLAGAAILVAAPAWGQSSPGFVQGQVLSATQLNSAFVAKLDYALLGNSATLNVGTTSGTVMAGDDSRVTGSASTSAANIFTQLQTINLNSATLPGAISGSGLLVGPADGVTGRIQVDGFGAISAFTVARYDGTAASPTAVQANDQVGGFNAHAYDGATLDGPIGSFRIYATDIITSAHWGSKACIATTATNTTTMADSLCQLQDGGVTIGSPTGGDKGAGTINATALFQAGVALSSTAAANTWTATQTFQLTDSGSAVGPLVNLDRNSASPAAADIIGEVRFLGRNSTPVTYDYADIQAEIVDPTAASEDSRLTFRTTVAGNNNPMFYIGGGLYAASLADPGIGKANMTEYDLSGVNIFTGAHTWAATQTLADIKTAGSTTTQSGCGTGAALATNSSDTAGKLTIGTSPSGACNILFSGTKGNAPFCTVNNASTGTIVYSVATNDIALSSGYVAGNVIYYTCIQN